MRLALLILAFCAQIALSAESNPPAELPSGVVSRHWIINNGQWPAGVIAGRLVHGEWFWVLGNGSVVSRSTAANGTSLGIGQRINALALAPRDQEKSVSVRFFRNGSVIETEGVERLRVRNEQRSDFELSLDNNSHLRVERTSGVMVEQRMGFASHTHTFHDLVLPKPDVVNKKKSDLPVLSSDIYRQKNTLITGSQTEEIVSIAGSPQGSAYAVGYTASPDFPIRGAVVDTVFRGSLEAFVVKISPSQQIDRITFLGGLGDDIALGVAIDSSGTVAVVGVTSSRAFPITPGAPQRVYGGGDEEGFLTVLTPDLDRILFSTFVGGERNDRIWDVAVSSSGYWLAGASNSESFAMNASRVGRTYAGQFDAFVVRIAKSNAPVFVTYVGGEINDHAYSLSLDADSLCWIAGYTTSRTFPVTENALSRNIGGDGDAFISALNADGDIMFSSYWGGSTLNDGFYDIDATGDRIVAAGYTGSNDLIVSSYSVQRSWRGYMDGMILSLSKDNYGSYYSTYIGGQGWDEIVSCYTDHLGRVVLAGRTNSPDFPLGKIHKGNAISEQQAYVAILDSMLSSIQASLFFGGSDVDVATTVSAGMNGIIHCAGITYSSNMQADDTVGTVFTPPSAFYTSFSPYISIAEFSSLPVEICRNSELFMTVKSPGLGRDSFVVVVRDLINSTVIDTVGTYGRADSLILWLTDSAFERAFQYRLELMEVGSDHRLAVSNQFVVADKPLIVRQPRDTVVCQGGPLALTFSVLSQVTPQYQWQRRADSTSAWVDMLQANSPILVLPQVNTLDTALRYRCAVTNSCGVTYSREISIGIRPAAYILRQPDDVVVCPGEEASFSLDLTDSVASGITWQRSLNNGSSWEDIQTDPKPPYVLTVSSAIQPGNVMYRARINQQCTVFSTSARVLFVPQLFFTKNPASVQLCSEGGTVDLEAGVNVSPDDVRWEYLDDDGVWLPLPDSRSLRISLNISDGAAHSYRCVVTDECGRTTASAVAVVKLTDPPALQSSATDLFLGVDNCSGEYVPVSSNIRNESPVQAKLISATSSVSGLAVDFSDSTVAPGAGIQYTIRSLVPFVAPTTGSLTFVFAPCSVSVTVTVHIPARPTTGFLVLPEPVDTALALCKPEYVTGVLQLKNVGLATTKIIQGISRQGSILVSIPDGGIDVDSDGFALVPFGFYADRPYLVDSIDILWGREECPGILTVPISASSSIGTGLVDTSLVLLFDGCDNLLFVDIPSYGAVSRTVQSVTSKADLITPQVVNPTFDEATPLSLLLLGPSLQPGAYVDTLVISISECDPVVIPVQFQVLQILLEVPDEAILLPSMQSGTQSSIVTIKNRGSQNFTLGWRNASPGVSIRPLSTFSTVIRAGDSLRLAVDASAEVPDMSSVEFYGSAGNCSITKATQLRKTSIQRGISLAVDEVMGWPGDTVGIAVRVESVQGVDSASFLQLNGVLTLRSDIFLPFDSSSVDYGRLERSLPVSAVFPPTYRGALPLSSGIIALGSVPSSTLAFSALEVVEIGNGIQMPLEILPGLLSVYIYDDGIPQLVAPMPAPVLRVVGTDGGMSISIDSLSDPLATLKIYDVTGREVADMTTLLRARLESLPQSGLPWSGTVESMGIHPRAAFLVLCGRFGVIALAVSISR